MTRVLVVDDDPEVLAALRRYLELADFEVETAISVRAAKILMRELRFEVVVTDMIMEEQDGLDLIRWVQNTFADTRLIAISGGGARGSDSYLSMARQSGADASLKKPVARSALIAEIRALIEAQP